MGTKGSPPKFPLPPGNRISLQPFGLKGKTTFISTGQQGEHTMLTFLLGATYPTFLTLHLGDFIPSQMSPRG